MNILLSIVLLASLFFINSVEAIWKPEPGTTWNIVLKGDLDIKKEKAQVVVIDVHSNSAEFIQSLHDAGKKVICYFSGGTYEDFRPDKDEYDKVDGLVKNKYKQWEGENWVDIRLDGLKPILKERMKLAASKKCDAVDVDNLDGCQDKSVMKKWSNPLTKEDTIVFAKWLSKTAHELGLAIGLKNALFMIDEVGADFDFAINESCANRDYNECALYKDFVKEKAVFGITYQYKLKYRTNRLCDYLKDLNISMITKERELVQSGERFKQSSCPYHYTIAYARKVVLWFCLAIIVVIFIYLFYRSIVTGKLKVWVKNIISVLETIIIKIKKLFKR